MKTITTALDGLRLLESAADRAHQLTGEASALAEMAIESHEVQHATAVQSAMRAEYAVEESDRLSLTFDAQVHEGNARVIAEQAARKAAEYAERIRLQAANLDRIAATILQEVAPVDLAVVVVGPMDPLVIQATQPPQQLSNGELAPVEADNRPVDPMTGNEVRVWREELGLSQQAMADRLGVTQATISAWERRGGDPIPSYRAAQIDGLVDDLCDSDGRAA